MAASRSSEKVEFRAGYTKWGQKLTLIGELETNGKVSWSLRQDALNQRDETSTIRGLTRESIKAIAAVIERDGR